MSGMVRAGGFVGIVSHRVHIFLNLPHRIVEGYEHVPHDFQPTFQFWIYNVTRPQLCQSRDALFKGCSGNNGQLRG
jgi:hypothetical protein